MNEVVSLLKDAIAKTEDENNGQQPPTCTSSYTTSQSFSDAVEKDLK